MFGHGRRLSLVLVLLGALLAAPGRSAETSGTGTCGEGATRLCLLGRFAVEATWFDRGGRERVAVALPLSAGSGAFSFFESDGADLLVQIEDARGGEGHFGVRFGALTDAAFRLRVTDISSGAVWAYENPRGHFAARVDAVAFAAAGAAASTAAGLEAPLFSAAAEVDAPVADFLEERAAQVGASAVASAADGAPCRGSATDLCLLGGRFRVRARYAPGARYGVARPVGAAGESGLFALGGSADLAVRVVDGRAVNGSFWVLASGLGATDTEVELTELESGRTRRFLLPGGSPTSRPELEAFSAAAATVQVTLDPSRATTGSIGPLGGSIQLTDAQGTKFLLNFPAQALAALTEVTVTPVAAIAGLPFSGGLKAGVRIEPEGLIPAASVLLTITPAPLVAPAQQLTFAFRGLSGELYLTSPRANQAAIVIPVHRLGGYGLGAGSAADLAAQLLRLPSHEEDRLSQRLAGLLLPLRRAGTASRTLPASVLKLLQTEFTARIKPKLPLIQQGQVLKYWPITQNFINSAKDTGLSLSLGAPFEWLGAAQTGGANGPLAQTNAAIIKGAKLALARNLAACTGSGGPTAAMKAYVAYNIVKSYHALGATDTTKLLNCVNFELHFDTELKLGDSDNLDQHTLPAVRLALSLNLAEGFFYGRVSTPETAIYNVPACTTSELRRNVAQLVVKRLMINRLGQYDDGSDLGELVSRVAVFYGTEPLLIQVWWSVYCPDPGTTETEFTSWSVLYGHFHRDEIVGIDLLQSFHMIMNPSADSRKFAEKAYQRTDSIQSEDTSFFLLHTPR